MASRTGSRRRAGRSAPEPAPCAGGPHRLLVQGTARRRGPLHDRPQPASGRGYARRGVGNVGRGGAARGPARGPTAGGRSGRDHASPSRWTGTTRPRRPRRMTRAARRGTSARRSTSARSARLGPWPTTTGRWTATARAAKFREATWAASTRLSADGDGLLNPDADGLGWTLGDAVMGAANDGRIDGFDAERRPVAENVIHFRHLGASVMPARDGARHRARRVFELVDLPRHRSRAPPNSSHGRLAATMMVGRPRAGAGGRPAAQKAVP